MFYTKILRPILFKTDPEWIHHVAVAGLGLVSRSKLIGGLMEKFCLIKDERLAVKLGNLNLLNPIGLPAGFDKYIEAPLVYGQLGFGFAELGSVTFAAQPGNLKPRLWRIPKDNGLIVYYGLSNDGVLKTKARMEKIKQRIVPLGISIAPTTGLTIDQMADDYIRTFNLLYPLADYITLNVSCPNVAACDIFSQISFIKELISRVGQLVKENKIKKNIFVKIGPDMKMEELDEVIDACVVGGVTGIIATNLIKNRAGLIAKSYPDEMDHPGGISGRLLAAKSDAVIAHIYQRAGDKLKIIGVGGIFSAADAYRKIKFGASALQVFTGFIYNGPLFIRELNLGLLKLLEKDGYKNISEAVGKGNV